MTNNENKEIRFQFFRYQILPVNQAIQLPLDNSFTSIDELISKKNDLFLDALTHIEAFEYTRSELVHQITHNQNNIVVLKIGVNRDLNRETRNFEVQELDTWPSTLILINNAPNIQKVAIELERKAFQGANTVAAIREQNLNRLLSRHQLHVRFSPIFESNKFWDIVDKYPNSIIKVIFDMVSPNMSNISSSLKLDLKVLNKSTNTQETSLTLTSDKNSHLTLARDNEFINSLVEYSAAGAGNITIKVKGLTRKIQTSNSVTETTVNSAEITGTHPSKLIEVLKEMLSS